MQVHDELRVPHDSLGARLWSDESGQDMAEYAVLLALVALAVLVSVIVLGDSISNTFNNISTSVSGAELSG